MEMSPLAGLIQRGAQRYCGYFAQLRRNKYCHVYFCRSNEIGRLDAFFDHTPEYSTRGWPLQG